MDSNSKYFIDESRFLQIALANKYGTQTYEEIKCIFDSAKEYWEYSKPSEESKTRFIKEFLYIFQFSIKRNITFLYTLINQNKEKKKVAILAVIPPGSTIIPKSSDYELASINVGANSKFLDVKWGFVSNGIELKIMDCSKRTFENNFIWVNLDRVFKDNRIESFFSIFHLFNYIRNETDANEPHARVRKKKANKKNIGRFPQREYRIPILKALIELGGSAAVSIILDHVFEIVGEHLTEVDTARKTVGGEYSWANTAQWERLVMKKEGYLESDSPRGIWEISTKGRKYYQEHKDY